MFLSTSEVLTKNGWIFLSSDTNIVNDVATFDPNSGKIEFDTFEYQFEQFSGEGIIIQNRLLNIIIPAYSRILTNQQSEINCYIRFPVRNLDKRGLTSFPTSGFYEGSNDSDEELLLYLLGSIIAKGKLIEDFIEFFIEIEENAVEIEEIMNHYSMQFTKEVNEIGNKKLTTFKIFNYKKLPFMKYLDKTLHPLNIILEIPLEYRLYIIDGILDNCDTMVDRFIYTNNDIITQEFVRILMTLSGFNSYLVNKAYSGLTTSIKAEPYATVHHSNFEKSVIEANLNNTFISGTNKYNTVIVKYTDKIFVIHTDNP